MSVVKNEFHYHPDEYKSIFFIIIYSGIDKLNIYLLQTKLNKKWSDGNGFL